MSQEIHTETHIGARLRSARDAKGLSAAEVADTLKIQMSFIQAIEALDRDSLPSIGYVLGYVRAYAGLVGIDGQEAVEAYKADSEVPENLGMRDRPHFVPKAQIRLPKGFFAASTVMACTAVLAFWYYSDIDAQSSALTGLNEAAAVENVAAEEASIDPDRMLIKATAPSWVEIKDADGKVIISRIMVAGESWEAKRDSGVTLSARDSGAFELYLGAELEGRIGLKGAPITDIKMPAQTVQPIVETPELPEDKVDNETKSGL